MMSAVFFVPVLFVWIRIGSEQYIKNSGRTNSSGVFYIDGELFY